ncbi:MAG: transposase family protein [Candidatus Brocadiales bacterium]
MTTGRFTEDQIGRALMKNSGMVTQTADSLNCDWSTVWRYLKKYPKLQEVREEAKEILIDKAENKLQELIEKGEASAIFFFLKCQAKHRGYVERQEVSNEHKFNSESISSLAQWIEDSLQPKTKDNLSTHSLLKPSEEKNNGEVLTTWINETASSRCNLPAETMGIM